MLARIDHDSAHEGSRMSTIEEIAAKGEILVNLHTSFPAERVADVDNFRSLLYYYGLLTMCGTRGDRLRMCIPNHCVREQYFGFLREYYQQAHPLDLSRLKDQIDDLAYDGVWKPFSNPSPVLIAKTPPFVTAWKESEICKASSKPILLLLPIIW